MYDADAWAAAHRPWSFRFQGREYVSVPVGTDTVQACWAAAARATREITVIIPDGGSRWSRLRDRFRRRLGVYAQEEAILRLLRAAFPRPWWRRFLPWPQQSDPVEMVRRMPLGQRMELLADFFEAQVATLGGHRQTSGSGSNGATGSTATRTAETLAPEE